MKHPTPIPRSAATNEPRAESGLDAEPNSIALDGVDFETFYARELPKVVRMAIVLTRSRGVAEELAHDAFFDAYRRWSTIGNYEDPAGWIRRAVINRASSFHRRRLVELRFLLHGDHALVAYEDALPDEQLWKEVRRLPLRQKQVVLLHYVDQLTTEEIASALQISLPSVKTHLQRARQTLNQRLANGTDHTPPTERPAVRSTPRTNPTHALTNGDPDV